MLGSVLSGPKHQILVVGFGGSVDSVVLVLRLGRAGFAGFSSNGFLVGNNGVILDGFTLSVIFLKIVETNLDLELTVISNDGSPASPNSQRTNGSGFASFLRPSTNLGDLQGFWVISTSHCSSLDEILINTSLVCLSMFYKISRLL